MTENRVPETPELRFSAVLMYAANLPGVRIDRAAYLRKALGRSCSEEQLRRAIDETPAAAGIPPEVLEKAANGSIAYETGKAGALSAAAGAPGLLFLPATLPADTAQYFGHMLRIAQKLAYLYSWPDLFAGEDDLDDATKGMLTLFLGVMFGVGSANLAVGRIAETMAQQVVKKLPQKALTQGVVYPLVKKVAGYLGVQMTKQTFAKGVSKAIPVVGAAVSGGLTVMTYRPMAKRLKNHLAELALAQSAGREARAAAEDLDDVLDIDDVQDIDDIVDIEEAEEAGEAQEGGSTARTGSALVSRIPRPGWKWPRRDADAERKEPSGSA